MKLLIVSDIHGKFEKFYNICILEKPDAILFLGDGVKDAKDVEYIFPDIEFFMVRGNCDYFDCDLQDEMIIEIEGMRFLLTHGHMYGVKRNYSDIIKKGIDENIDIVLFGHTHTPDYVSIDEDYKKIILFNPGAVLNNFYGIIELEKNKKIKFLHKRLD